MCPELQKRADRADQSVLFFLAGANFWEKHAKNRRKHAKTGENTRKQAKNRRFFGANFFWGKIGANFYAFCNYAYLHYFELWKQILKPAATIGVVPTNIRSVSKNQQQVLACADIFLEW